MDPILLNNEKPIIFVDLLYNKNILKKIKNKRVLAFTGIAHPENFFSSMIKYGFKLIKKIEFSDHHMYKRKDFQKIISIASKLKLQTITTEKDHVKVPNEFKEKILAIPMKIKFNEKKFYDIYKKKIEKNV